MLEDEQLPKIIADFTIGFANWLLLHCSIEHVNYQDTFILCDITGSNPKTTEQLYTLYLESL